MRFNEQGPDGLINVPAPGARAKLNKAHRAFLARIVEVSAREHGVGFSAHSIIAIVEQSFSCHSLQASCCGLGWGGRE
jgi:hypothetical protein